MPEGLGRLSIIVFDGEFARIHYALVMASAAAATNRPATLFFTGRALNALIPKGWRMLEGDAAEADARLAERGVATFSELLEACRDLGVRFIACEMGLRAEGIDRADIDPALRVEVAGIVTFLNDARPDGGLLFV